MKPVSKKDIEQAQRTYSSLSRLSVKIKNYISEKDNKFLTAFSSFYLLQEPKFDFHYQTRESVQTFYANHYLKESLSINNLPSPNELKKYYFSEEFKNKANFIFDKLLEENNFLKEIIFENDDRSLNSVISNLIIALEKIDIKLSSSIKVSNFDDVEPEILEKLEKDGFYVLENFFDKNYFKKLYSITKNLAEKENLGIGYFYGKNDKNQRIYNLIAKDPLYREFLTCPFIHKLCSIYFNRDTFHDKYGLNSFSANIIHSGGSEGAWHLDSVLPDPIPVKYPIRLQIIISLDEFTKLNGSTAVAPESHKFGRRPNNLEAKELGNGYVVECPPGSLLLFNSNTWHKNTANQSPNSRYALLASFAASYFMEVCGEEEHLSIISENQKNELHPRLQQMIGYKRAIKKAAILN